MRIETWTIIGEAFHFGQHGLGQEETSVTFSSDSLFAALVARLACTGGEAAVEAWMEAFIGGDPPFLLTSTFPLVGAVRFYPTLAAYPTSGEVSVRLKDLKKTLYLSEELFRRILAGEPLSSFYPSSRPLQQGQMLISKEELSGIPGQVAEDGRVWVVEQRPRVTIGRADQKPNLFFTGRVVFAAGCGLWFGVRWLREDHACQRLLEGLLADLAEAGLGAERSSGFGQCLIQPGPAINLPAPEGHRWVTLSRYVPARDETGALLDQSSAYRLVTLTGWVDSPDRSGQRRRPVTLVREGSVLGPLAKLAPGRVEDVRPRYIGDPDPLKHAVYRSGLALGVSLEGGAT